MGYWREGKGYRVYCGIDEAGKKIMRYTSTIEDARRILATCRQKKGRYDLDLFALPEKVKVEIYNVLLKCQELGVSLSDLLDSYCEKTGKNAESKTCRECADLYLTKMKELKRRESSIYSMRYFVHRYFYDEIPVSAVTLEDVKAKFNSYPEKSRKNWKRYCSIFFNFCVKNGWCARNLADDLTVPTIERQRPTIFTVSQARQLLSQAQGAVLTFAVIGLFCGLRPTEFKRLKKADIDLEKRIIRIGSDVAKTRTFRNVVISEAPFLWLKKYGINLVRWQKGNVVAARQILGLKEWPHDVLRHTAASYMLARDKSADAVALQLGNSPIILHKHYKNLVTDAEAAEFWNLTPESVGR